MLGAVANAPQPLLVPPRWQNIRHASFKLGNATHRPNVKGEEADVTSVEERPRQRFPAASTINDKCY
jgi:hypothetical protein